VLAARARPAASTAEGTPGFRLAWPIRAASRCGSCWFRFAIAGLFHRPPSTWPRRSSTRRDTVYVSATYGRGVSGAPSRPSPSRPMPTVMNRFTRCLALMATRSNVPAMIQPYGFAFANMFRQSLLCSRNIALHTDI
jgi:hypothetical protein